MRTQIVGAAILAATLAPLAAHSQDDPPAAPVGRDVEDILAEYRATARPAPDAAAADELGPLDRFVFGTLVRSRAARRAALLDRLEVRVEAAVRRYGLTALDAWRLAAAGRGDILAFLTRYEAVRRQYEEDRRIPSNEVTLLPTPGVPAPRDALTEWGDVTRQEYEVGPFGADSLFARTLATILAERDAAGEPGPERP